MRIGIITFHRAYNYGAVLQAYALQKTIEKLGYDVEIIDYHSDTIEALYKPFSPFIYNIRTLKFITQIKKKKKYNHFLKKYLKLSESIQKKDLIKIEDNYDCIITGSDQVWCEKCLQKDKSYFLDFVKNAHKKSSYAASFGKEKFDRDNLSSVGHLLMDYMNISVREQSGKKMLEELGLNVNINVDPTLLLSKGEWAKIYCDWPKEDYILLYTVLEPYKLFDYVKELSKRTGLKVIYLNDKLIKRDALFTYKTAVSPEEFVAYFANAKYVVTNSFHGTVFSLINHVKVAVEYEAVGRRNIRSEELLNLLGLNREINDINFDIEQEVDWEQVDELIQKEREKSFIYLKKVCGEI